MESQQDTVGFMNWLISCWTRLNFEDFGHASDPNVLPYPVKLQEVDGACCVCLQQEGSSVVEDADTMRTRLQEENSKVSSSPGVA
eukprot:scaffold395686_cov28-Prasinocladus_malaysianus.AAC.1